MYYTGGTIIMDHGHGISTIYSHLEKLDVKVGDKVKSGDIAFIVEGTTTSILTAERLVLNCMQRMSAIATKTNYLNF